MYETVFTLFLAGCAHGGADCVPLEQVDMHGANFTQCDQALEARLQAETAEYPEYLGLCLSVEEQRLSGVPAWWPTAVSMAAALPSDTAAELGKM